jgi:DNA-binding CsgD family transcriptional regulator
MWEERAHRARGEVVALAASGLGVTDLYRAAIQVVDAQVPNELSCWALIDPGDLLIAAMVSGPARIPAEYEPRLADAEYRSGEPDSFADLARRRVPVSRSADRDPATLDRGARFSTVWRPLGIDQEVRVQFLGGSSCWGAAGLVRSRSGFSDREVEFLAAVAPALAGATRLAVRTETTSAPAFDGPAVVVLDRSGAVASHTPGAEDWRRRFDGFAPGRFQALLTLVATGARASRSGTFRSHLRDADGNWAVIRATPLLGAEEEQLAITIDAAGPADLLSLRLLACGLTGREREVCRLVLSGLSTNQITQSLYISANTVQDHLKAVFDKVGVRSRRELVSELQPAA